MATRRGDISFEHFRMFTFGSDEELIGFFGSLERAEQKWRSVRDEFLARWTLWGMPAAWWRFEPGIPADLRSGPHAILSEADAQEWARLDRERREYLRSIGIDPTPSRRAVPFGHARPQ